MRPRRDPALPSMKGTNGVQEITPQCRFHQITHRAGLQRPQYLDIPEIGRQNYNSSARVFSSNRLVNFRIFEHYGVDTTRREPFEANWPAVSSSGRVSGGIAARCLNLHLRNQHAVNRTSLGDLHQSVKLILG
jgi:hypothetical protein